VLQSEVLQDPLLPLFLQLVRPVQLLRSGSDLLCPGPELLRSGCKLLRSRAVLLCSGCGLCRSVVRRSGHRCSASGSAGGSTGSGSGPQGLVALFACEQWTG
jgi:hypothetical protein